MASVAQMLADAVSGNVTGLTSAPTIQLPAFEIDLRENDEADKGRVGEYPDGFLFYSNWLEIYPAPKTSQETRVNLISAVLGVLWARGLAAVAACDYEAELPAGGGHKNRPFPWIAKENPAEKISV